MTARANPTWLTPHVFIESIFWLLINKAILVFGCIITFGDEGVIGD